MCIYPVRIFPAFRVSMYSCTNLTRILALFSILYFTLIAATLYASGQTTSIIQGTVTDQQHLAIVGTSIILTSPTSVTEFRATTDAAGTFRIPGLQAGNYNLRAAKSGFA